MRVREVFHNLPLMKQGGGELATHELRAVLPSVTL